MKKYFTGLDTLRAIAALVVVWGHIELLKAEKGISASRFEGIIQPSGHIAVVLFFSPVQTWKKCTKYPINPRSLIT